MLEVAPGIHRWTGPHPEWRPRNPWAHEVASFAVTGAPELILIDPLAPADAEALWPELDRLVEARETQAIALFVTIHYHVRSVAKLHRRYRDALPVSVHGHPSIADSLGRDVPLDPIEPGESLPAGARAFAIGSPRRRETPIYLPHRKALAFGDAVVGVGGELRVWEDTDGGRRDDWYRNRFLPTLRPLLELDTEHVLVTHGPPAVGNGGEQLAAALRAPPWNLRTA